MNRRLIAPLSALAALVLLQLPSPTATAAKTPPRHTSTLGTSMQTLPARLKPGEYLWIPAVSPTGPIVMVVSLPTQLAYVYRNGVLIGATTVSTGKKGHETPTGVFTILQKNADHYSNIYNNAPMPYMQRLTWSGVALHAGKLPGYPASHGCVRMPYEFAQKLFAETKTGLTVVVSNEEQFPDTVVHPGLVAPVTAAGEAVTAPSVVTESFWRPEASLEGPVSILVTLDDRRISVFRGGVEIGRSAFTLIGSGGTRKLVVLTRLETPASAPIDPKSGQPIARWLAVSGEEQDTVSTDRMMSRFSIPPEFLRNAVTVIGPGTTMVFTQAASTASTRTTVEQDFAVVKAEQPTKSATPGPAVR
jgi:lipoprotein-anchoring transpeptidase ErfK/SrfK